MYNPLKIVALGISTYFISSLVFLTDNVIFQLLLLGLSLILLINSLSRLFKEFKKPQI